MRSVVMLAPAGVPESIVAILSSAGWNVGGTCDARHARELVGQLDARVGIVVLGNAADAHAQSLTPTMRECPELEWLALCEPGALERLRTPELILDLCFDYLTLPVDPMLLRYATGHAHGRAELRRRKTDRDRETVDSALPQIVARSRVMSSLGQQVKRFAATNAAVLIGGESGTGKELVARAIHTLSERAGCQFVAVNCGGLPATLVQSELFGSEKGAFTGAQQMRKGLIESADGGTLFLDEIGDLPLEQQANLLRFLETKIITRLGSTASIRVDVRVIAATNVDLPVAIGEGRFRADLYHRLNVLSLRVPALRERQEDIELLAEHFFRQYSRQQRHVRAQGFSASALQALLDHSWPGNVRELINRINRAVVLSEGDLITPQDLGLGGTSGGPAMVKLDLARYAAEADAIRCSLFRTANNVSSAARELGVSRMTFYRLLAKHGIKVASPGRPLTATAAGNVTSCPPFTDPGQLR